MTTPRNGPERRAGVPKGARSLDAVGSGSPPPVDPERAAMLFDRRLTPDARAELLDRITASPEELETFAEAAAVMRELEGDASPIGVRPRDGRRRWRSWLSVAATLVIAAGGLSWWIASRASQRDGPESVLAALSVDGAIPVAREGPPWLASRGAETPPASMTARAIRIGVLMADVAVLERGGSGDSTAARARLRIADLLGAVTGGATAAVAHRELAARGGRETAAERSRATRLAGDVVGARPLTAGVWLEAARLAAVAGDTAFFQSGAGDRAVATIAGLPGLTPAARDALASLDRSRRGPAPVFATIEAAATTLVRELAQ